MYWPVENIRSKFEAACEKRSENPSQVLVDFIGADSSDESAVEAFWGVVKTNLQAGRIRLVFLADKIPTELQRIVEFLNTQMDPAEVIAVELRQFVGEGVKTLVPRVLAKPPRRFKEILGVSERKHWDEASFFADAKEIQGLTESQIAAVRKLYAFSKDCCDSLTWEPEQQEVPSIRNLVTFNSFSIFGLF